MLFKVNSVLFKVTIFLCIIYCADFLVGKYNNYTKHIEYFQPNVIVTQASFYPFGGIVK